MSFQHAPPFPPVHMPPGPMMMPPQDPELQRRIHTTAQHVASNPQLLGQLLIQHTNDQSLAFIHPSAGQLFEYFQWAIQCKSMDPSSDPAQLAIANASGPVPGPQWSTSPAPPFPESFAPHPSAILPSPLLPVPDLRLGPLGPFPFPLPPANVDEEQVRIIRTVLNSIVEYTDTLSDDATIFAKGSSSPPTHFEDLFKIDRPNPPSGLPRVVQTFFEDVQSYHEQQIELHPSLSVSQTVASLCSILLHLIIRPCYQLGAMPIPPNEITDTYHEPLNDVLESPDGDRVSHCSSRAFGLSTFVIGVAFYLHANHEISQSPIDYSLLWTSGILPWTFRALTLLCDALGRLYGRGPTEIRDARGHSRKINPSIDCHITLDCLSRWLNPVLLRLSGPEARGALTEWRVAPRVFACSVENQFRLMSDGTPSFEKPRNEIIDETIRHDPYLRALPPNLATAAPFGRLMPPNVINEAGVLTPDVLPVGVLSSVLAESSRKAKAMQKAFMPYTPVDLVRTSIPPLHPNPPADMCESVRQCLAEMKSQNAINTARRKRQFELNRSDSDDDPRLRLDDVLGGRRGPLSTGYSLPNAKSSASTLEKLAPKFKTAPLNEYLPPGPPEGAYGPQASANAAPRKRGLGAHDIPIPLSSSGPATSSDRGFSRRMDEGSSHSDAASIFDQFRQRRSGNYHKAIVNFKMGQSGSTLRCYVCQQEGHFAKDCKFGLN